MFRARTASRLVTQRARRPLPGASSSTRTPARIHGHSTECRTQSHSVYASAFKQPVKQMSKLGTETAFAVGAACAQYAATTGNKTYPFHLGDLNIPTPRVIVEASFQAIRSGKTGYCPPAGIPELRKALAEVVGEARGIDYDMHNVCVQTGGKPVISKFLMTCMEPGDEVLYPNPGYPIYESQINYHDGVPVPYSFEDDGNGNLSLNVDKLRNAITDKTKVFIWNDLHNPTGYEANVKEREAVAELCNEHDLLVLADEAYFDVRYKGTSQSIASLPGMDSRTVILYTFSKKYAMTGWRLGAAIGPAEQIAAITRLNVNDESCTNHFVQYGGVAGLLDKEQVEFKAMLEELRSRRDTTAHMLQQIEGLKCSVPDATFYLFPNVTELCKRKGFDSAEHLRAAALEATGVSFCAKEHFGSRQPHETEEYIRFAYSGISEPDIVEGLEKLQNFLK